MVPYITTIPGCSTILKSSISKLIDLQNKQKINYTVKYMFSITV